MPSPDDYVRRAQPSSQVIERRSSPLENPSIALSTATTEDLLAFFGISTGKAQLPHVTIESALEVPAVFGVVSFLSRTMAALPLHSFRKTADGEPQRVDGDIQMLLNEAPNPEWSSFAWRQYFWQQVFTGGRGCTYIERSGVRPVALWPMDPTRTSVRRQGGKKIYRFDAKEYPAADVIDVPYMLKANQLDAYGPIAKGNKAIGLAIAMNDYAGAFFGSGGTPPLALEGPLPQGPDGFKRAQADIQRAIDLARKSGNQFFGMPPGHKLTPVGINPDDGQMTQARLFQIQEIARIWGVPPAFVQDLSTGTFTNTEQQDLQLVKHLIAHWAKALEDEANLKLFGQRRRSQYVEHNLDGVMRGDLLSRINALGRGIQTGQLTPDEARGLENRPPKPGGDKLYIQGATVPIELAGKVQVKPGTNDNGDNGDAGGKTED